VTIEFQGLEMRWWLAGDGTTLRGESLLGGTRFREEKEHREAALAGIGKTRVDLVANSRVKPEGNPLPEDDFIQTLRVRLTGLDPNRFPSLGGARIGGTEGSVILRLESAKVPLKEPPSVEEVAPHLASTLSITADAPGIKALAKELMERAREKSGEKEPEEKNPGPNTGQNPSGDNPETTGGSVHPSPPSGRYARAVFDWVRREIHREFVIGFPTAAEVLETRRGDCNEHTALVAALCRAAGIPCKAVAGVVYLNGAFYYHAWNEVYLDEASGGPAWLPIDAALGQWPADATHIKFVEGDPAEQTAIMTLFGNLEIEILSAEGKSS
jgi:transglutaminase-like putative cysteine protease